ncbi:MAG TPA: transglycosylase SLT domain-containing protein [Sporichthyaceae bacterium]|jgi:hypothetical protein|nr:transglycosylase SLT domain-containing protein [Sporichthyaceae bacterium]
MGSHRRPKRFTYRDTVITTATGGILFSGSVLGIASGAQAAGAASLTAGTQIASAGYHPRGWDNGDDDGSDDGYGSDCGYGDDDDGWWIDDDSCGDGNGDWGDQAGPGRHRGEHHQQDRRPTGRQHQGGHQTGQHGTGHPTRSGDPKEIAREMIHNDAQFGCFSHVIDRESGWNPRAGRVSGAYGLPQALPGRKMASAGADWRTNPRTQIRWALGYMHERYGSACGAWAHWRRHHNY